MGSASCKTFKTLGNVKRSLPSSAGVSMADQALTMPLVDIEWVDGRNPKPQFEERISGRCPSLLL